MSSREVSGTAVAMLKVKFRNAIGESYTYCQWQGPWLSMRTEARTIWKLAKISACCAVTLFFGASSARAEKHLSGTYRCVSVEIAGKTKPCSAPALEMNSDGSYQILAERGTYEILKGGWLVLSASKNHGRARLDGNKEIVFEFVSGGKKSKIKITYRRKYERPSGWVSG